MSEQTTKSLSISFRVDDGIIDHNNRVKIAKNVDAARISDNVVYVQRDIRELYQELFGVALEKYNANQKRRDKKILNYFKHICKSKKEKPFYEVVVEFGDNVTCGRSSGNWDLAKKMLDEYFREFEQRNPNLKVFNAVLHLDEATPHLHIDFVPVGHKAVRGLDVKNSMSAALREQGFTSSNKFQNEWVAWEESEQNSMTEILRAYGLSRDVKNDKHEHLTVDEYKQRAMNIEVIGRMNRQINELKKKNPSELTADEFELLKNQNDFLRSEIVGYREQNAALAKKASADFVPLEIYDDDRLQFVTGELQKRGIKFVEENTTLYVPECARQQALALAESYHKENPLGIRERVKLDIDRLVYCSRDFDELLEWLKRRGYAVKCGKYTAIKPPFGERFVRLKTLGSSYLPKNLETRIAQKDNFINSAKAKFESANALEKPFHITVMNTIIAVKEFRLIPRKLDKYKIYAFANDANIDFLAQQLVTIGEFHFTSREDMCAKAEELQAAGTDEAKLQLERVREVIQTYDKIICSDYIGELIKAQQTEQSPQSKSKQHNHHRH